MVVGYLGISGLLGWDALRWERRPDGRPLVPAERLVRTLRVSAFNCLWLLVVPRALADLAFRRGSMRYVKMEHSGPAGPSTGRTRDSKQGSSGDATAFWISGR